MVSLLWKMQKHGIHIMCEVNKTKGTFSLGLSCRGRCVRRPWPRCFEFVVGLQLHLHRIVVTDTESLGKQRKSMWIFWSVTLSFSVKIRANRHKQESVLLLHQSVWTPSGSWKTWLNRERWRSAASVRTPRSWRDAAQSLKKTRRLKEIFKKSCSESHLS